MNCRRVNHLLSAYVDSELTGTEMLEIRAHLADCSACRRECEELQQTKRLLGSLALRAPRRQAEFEQALLQTVQTTRPKQPSPLGWLVPRSLLAWYGGAASAGVTPARLRTATAAMAMSFAGLLLATTALDRSGDRRAAALDAITSGARGISGAVSGNRQGAATLASTGIVPPGYGVYPPYVAPHAVPRPTTLRLGPTERALGPGTSLVGQAAFYPANDGINDGYRYFSTLVSR